MNYGEEEEVHFAKIEIFVMIKKDKKFNYWDMLDNFYMKLKLIKTINKFNWL